MKRKRKLSTRKRTALRRCGWLVAVVVLASVTGLYRFLPIQAVWVMADLKDIQHPQVVERFYDGSIPVTRFALHYLVDGDDAMMLCTAGYHPLIGWYDRGWCKAETWNGEPLHGGIYTHSQGGEGMAWLFGRVDDGAIQSLTLERTVEPLEGEAYTEVWSIPREDLLEKNGKRYILMKLDGAAGEKEQESRITWRLTGRAGGGQIVTAELARQSWAALG